MKFRSGENIGSAAELLLGVTVVDPDEASMTDQSFKEEADINVIVKRFGITGQILGVEKPPALEDFGEIFDFRSAMDVVNAANRAFMSLDAEVRARFLNDPGRYVNFCSERNEDGSLKNYDEMLKMGLAVPKPVVIDPPPMKVEVINPQVPPAVK